MANAFKFLREVKYEGQKVTWSSREEVTKLTIVVLVVAVVMSFILFTADWAISSVVELLLNK